VSQENVRLLRVLEDCTNRGRMSQRSDVEIRSLFHPDVKFLPLSAATEGAYQGIAGIERFIADNEAVFEEFETHYEYLDLDERVLTWGTLRVKARQSGIDTDIPVGGVVEFREGKIVRWQAFGSKDEALKAVGLEE
jgi:limonene-1,2-epoxide hydrolase